MLSGWLLAVLTAVFVDVLLLVVMAGTSGSASATWGGSIVLKILLMALIGVPIALATILPAIVVPSVLFLLWAEKAGMRRPLAYAIAGVLIGAGGISMQLLHSAFVGWLDNLLFVLTGTASGFVAGLVYWCIAGRAAGVR